jgi:hypothetical protein
MIIIYWKMRMAKEMKPKIIRSISTENFVLCLASKIFKGETKAYMEYTGMCTIVVR